MNNPNRLSIRAFFHKAIVAVRVKLNIRPRCTMTQFAENAGLPIVELENRPPNFAGYLDWHKNPCFIAVNSDLPSCQQTWFIAQQVAICAHQRRCNSIAMNRPWKWNVLDAAPQEMRNKIHAMDIEYRAYWYMLFFSGGDDYRTFVRQNRWLVFKLTFVDNVIAYELAKLQVKLWVAEIGRKFSILINAAT